MTTSITPDIPAIPDSGTLGRALRAARKRVRLSQLDAAKQIGVARTTLVAIEAGQRRIKVEELTRLADIYEVQPSSLLTACATNDADAHLLALSEAQKRVILRLLSQAPDGILQRIALNSFGPIGNFGSAEVQEAIACILIHHLTCLEEARRQSEWLQESQQGA